MFLKAKNWSTRVTWHGEEDGEVLGPLRGGQGQVGDVVKSPSSVAARRARPDPVPSPTHVGLRKMPRSAAGKKGATSDGHHGIKSTFSLHL